MRSLLTEEHNDSVCALCCHITMHLAQVLNHGILVIVVNLGKDKPRSTYMLHTVYFNTLSSHIRAVVGSNTCNGRSLKWSRYSNNYLDSSTLLSPFMLLAHTRSDDKSSSNCSTYLDASATGNCKRCSRQTVAHLLNICVPLSLSSAVFPSFFHLSSSSGISNVVVVVIHFETHRRA